jgi:branched-chain amino acid transport system substrate-binding protein
MQVVEQAIIGTNSLDDGKLAEFTRNAIFKTVVGDVKFGDAGNWSEARVLQVQYQNIRSGDLSTFKGPGTQVVVWPPDLASGSLVYPYTNAKQSK